MKRCLISEATDRETAPLIVAVSARIAIAIDLVVVQGTCRRRLRRAPPVTVVAYIVEITIEAVAETPWET